MTGQGMPGVKKVRSREQADKSLMNFIQLCTMRESGAYIFGGPVILEVFLSELLQRYYRNEVAGLVLVRCAQ